MAIIIGPLTLPSDFKIKRVGGRITGRPQQIGLKGYHDIVYHTGTNLPTFRYEGWIQTLDSNVALNWMETLRELFRNPNIDYAMYTNIDKKFYFFCNSYTYERPKGYKRYFTFTLDVTWVGVGPYIRERYESHEFLEETNDWGM